MTTYGDDDIFGNLKAAEAADFAQATRGGSTAAAPKADNRPTFPCESCAGSGLYRGHRVHQEESKCFACGGRGFFYQSREKRQASRTKAASTKADALAAKQAEFETANEGMMAFLQTCTWSPFAVAMVEAFGKYGYLTENQIGAANRMRAKQVERTNQREAEKAERIANAPVVDLSPIQEMFDRATASGLKRTTYRAEGLVLKPAKATGRNPGAIYVTTTTDEYLGKVVAGRFQAVACATDEHKAAILTIAKDPGEAAVRWGKKTGECSCCGRELTDPVSVARGIGPICAEKWGL